AATQVVFLDYDADSIRAGGFRPRFEQKRRVHPLKIRIATLSLTILSLALTASAGTIYSEGPILGTANAFFITGPTYPNFLGSYQDISNGFVVAPGNGGTPNTLE